MPNASCPEPDTSFPAIHQPDLDPHYPAEGFRV
jgi:hypothetical protein